MPDILQQQGEQLLAAAQEIMNTNVYSTEEKAYQLRTLLEQAVRQRLPPKQQRLSFYEGLRLLSQQVSLSNNLRARLHKFRKEANAAEPGKQPMPVEELADAADALQALIVQVYGLQQVPAAVRAAQSLAQEEAAVSANPPVPAEQRPLSPELLENSRLKVVTVVDSEGCFEALPEAEPFAQPVRFWLNHPEWNSALRPALRYLNFLVQEPAENGEDHFALSPRTREVLQQMPVRCPEIRQDEAGRLYPLQVVVDPDFLVDVTAISECFEQADARRSRYFVNQLLPQESTFALFRGKLVNDLFDRALRVAGTAKDLSPLSEKGFQDVAVELFRRQPEEWLARYPLEDKEATRFFKDLIKELREFYNHILEAINHDFRNANELGKVPPLDRSRVLVEPSFISAAYGIGGRLDLLSLPPKPSENAPVDIVEVKSSRRSQRGDAKASHKVQAQLYYQLLKPILAATRAEIRPRLFYPRYGVQQDPLNRVLQDPAQDRRRFQRAMNIRNEILLMEVLLAYSPNRETFHKTLIKVLDDEADNPQSFRTKDQQALLKLLGSFDTLRWEYFYRFYSFAQRERRANKVDYSTEYNRSQAALWLVPKDAAKNYNLVTGARPEMASFAEQAENPLQRPVLRFRLPRATEGQSPAINFRRGDRVVMYPALRSKHGVEYNPLRVLVLRGFVEETGEDFVRVAFRHPQVYEAYFRPKKDLPWAIEGETQDLGLDEYAKTLVNFLADDPDDPDTDARRDLLLGLTPPAEPAGAPEITLSPATEAELSPEHASELRRALRSPAYYLLEGPPGTGKTSRFLKNLVQEWRHSHPDANLLAMAYTNRAVDEICEHLAALGENFLRVGSRNTADPRWHAYSLQELSKDCTTRRQLQAALEERKVVVGTVASMHTKPHLFQLKRFTFAVLDEASQVLEPQILPLLRQVEKFVLVGDTRQLPAVVVQSPGETAVPDGPLPDQLGLTNLRNSYFERLLHLAQRHAWHWVHGMLTHQSRMHHELMAFPSTSFYGGRLQLSEDETCRARQQAPWQLPLPEGVALSAEAEALRSTLQQQRVAFLLPDDAAHPAAPSWKANPAEAHLVCACLEVLAHSLVYQQQQSLHHRPPVERVGVITPFRDQIGLLRQLLGQLVHRLGAAEFGWLNKLKIDTVERFQGSQADHILLSFVVRQPWQLQAITAPATPPGTAATPNNSPGGPPTEPPTEPPVDSPVTIDRKLNVAITRAREQLVLTGAPQLLRQDPVYRKLLEAVGVE